MLRTARRRSGLTVRQLAAVTRVAESRISDYEHGRHQPSVAMLQRLLDATDHDLVTVPKRTLDVRRNAEKFADLLSFVDAVPFSELQRISGRSRPDPPTWADLINPSRRT